MFRRIGIVALAAMAYIALAAVDDTDAHWTIKDGKLVYHSLDCESVIKDWDPTLVGQGVCSTTATATEIRCYNPNGQYNDQGTSFNPIPFEPVSGPVQLDTIKKKGKSTQAAGHLRLEVLTDDEVSSLGLTWAQAGCPNSNWTVRALLREADLLVDVYQCNVSDGNGGWDCSNVPLDPSNPDPNSYTYAYTALFACTLPAEFTFENPPGDGDEMNCNYVTDTHVD